VSVVQDFFVLAVGYPTQANSGLEWDTQHLWWYLRSRDQGLCQFS
jgi:hypothetical protein